MANVLCLTCVCLLFLFSGAANAQGYMATWTTGWERAGTSEAVGRAWLKHYMPGSVPVRFYVSSPGDMEKGTFDLCSVEYPEPDFATRTCGTKPPPPPPDNDCGKLAGKPYNQFVDEVGDYLVDFGKQSDGWRKKVMGTVQNSCPWGGGIKNGRQQGCLISGQIYACVSAGPDAGVACSMKSPMYTGTKCGGEDDTDSRKDDEQCAPGYEPSNYAPGVCIPKETQCAAGYEPSKYAAGVCIPAENTVDNCEDPKSAQERVKCQAQKSRCPKGQVESLVNPGTCVKGNVDGTGKDKDGNDVKCEGGVCTGVGGASKPQGEFCKENPKSNLCGDDEKGSFSGACNSDFRCEGDAVQCAMAREQHKRNCQLFDTDNEYYKGFEAAKGKDGDVTEELTTDGGDIGQMISRDSLIGSGSCMSDLTLSINGSPVVIPFGEYCPYFEYLGYILVAFSLLAAIRIVGSAS